MTLLDYLASHPLAFVLCTILLGLLVGSFLNVVVHRLPKMMERNWKAEAREALGLEPEPKQATYNLVLPNSACPRCGHEIRPWENIPLVSYLALGGKCSSCKAAIGKRYPLVELATALLSGYVAWHFGFTWQAGAMLLLTWGLLAMSLIDADHQLLPDVLVLPLLWLGLIANHFGLFASLDDALFGAVFGYLSLWSVFWLFKLVTGKEGHGLRRLQAAGHARCLGRLADPAADHPAVVAGRGDPRGDHAAPAQRRKRHADPLRSLSGDCRVDCFALG